MKAKDISRRQYIKYNNQILQIKDIKHDKPGKGGAIVKFSCVDIKNDKKYELRYNVDDFVENVFLETKSYSFVYPKGNMGVLINQETYEELEIDLKLIPNYNVDKIYEIVFINDQFYFVK